MLVIIHILKIGKLWVSLAPNQEMKKPKNQDSSSGQCDSKANSPKQNAFGANKFTFKKSRTRFISLYHQNHISVKLFNISPGFPSKDRVFYFT